MRTSRTDAQSGKDVRKIKKNTSDSGLRAKSRAGTSQSVSRRNSRVPGKDPEKPAGSRKKTAEDTQDGILTQGSQQNGMSMFLAALVVLVLLITVGVNGISLNRRLHENRARIRILRGEIRTEEERAEDIEEYRRYTKTDAYIEEVAREKLGLIYEGETVFKEMK